MNNFEKVSVTLHWISKNISFDRENFEKGHSSYTDIDKIL